MLSSGMSVSISSEFHIGLLFPLAQVVVAPSAVSVAIFPFGRSLWNSSMSVHCSDDWGLLTLLCVKWSLSGFLRPLSTSVLLSTLLFCSFVSSVVGPASPFCCCALWTLCSTSAEGCRLNVLGQGPPLPRPGPLLSGTLSLYPATLTSSELLDWATRSGVFACWGLCTCHFMGWVPCPGPWRDGFFPSTRLSS